MPHTSTYTRQYVEGQGLSWASPVTGLSASKRARFLAGIPSFVIEGIACVPKSGDAARMSACPTFDDSSTGYGSRRRIAIYAQTSLIHNGRAEGPLDLKHAVLRTRRLFILLHISDPGGIGKERVVRVVSAKHRGAIGEVVVNPRHPAVFRSLARELLNVRDAYVLNCICHVRFRSCGGEIQIADAGRDELRRPATQQLLARKRIHDLHTCNHLAMV